MNKNDTGDPRKERKSQDQLIQSKSFAIYTQWFIVLLFIVILPFSAHADILSSISNFFSGNSTSQTLNDTDDMSDLNSQNVPLLESSINFNTLAATGGGNILTTDNDEALVSDDGPSGTLANVSSAVNTGQISQYVVQTGDTLSSIAKMFGISENTIVWANDLKDGTPQVGQILVILPVSGITHTVVAGDTLESIAKQYGADAGEIAQFNNLTGVDASLPVGSSIIIPNAEDSAKVSAPIGKGVVQVGDKIYYKGVAISRAYLGGSGPDYPGYYIRPLVGGVKTQGLHGYNAVDIGTPVGTPLLAAASGEVIVSKSSGWNGGYGDYIVISHPNNTETLYAHMSDPYVVVGQMVVQGQVIGLSGNTGLSTGPHVHFEVRGAVNPLGP